ncbi:MAG TPA: HD domain-containing phosphohydrolase [Anaerolineales bacterium]|jgi:putative two-component system response regulator|nr:HD domain-containing phosphohydrolase [Anaerolineales bacterium]
MNKESNVGSLVLIVDDEYIGRETLQSVLEGEGYQLEMAESGMQAIEKAKQLLPDVILLDVMMPGMTGFEVCQRIRSDPQIAEIPIIILTALDDRESLLNALKAGADDFISKPFDRYELRARLLGITRLNRYQKLLQERAKLREANAQLLNAYEATIEGLSHALDLRDRETEGHSRRVTEVTVRLAQALSISEEEITHIRRGALLHDIGKIGIPDSILHKPDTLTEEEWVIMRKHPRFAHDMLSPIEYLRPALSIPYSHHEKWDGTGYPRSLKGEEIPLSARLFAIADVWDALTSNRPYRDAWTEEQALAYIREQSGKHFDPHVVDLFFRVIEGS